MFSSFSKMASNLPRLLVGFSRSSSGVDKVASMEAKALAVVQENMEHYGVSDYSVNVKESTYHQGGKSVSSYIVKFSILSDCDDYDSEKHYSKSEDNLRDAIVKKVLNTLGTGVIVTVDYNYSETAQSKRLGLSKNTVSIRDRVVD